MAVGNQDDDASEKCLNKTLYNNFNVKLKQVI